MGYLDARKQLLQHGFVTVKVSRSDDDTTSYLDASSIPEAVFCRGTGAGGCTFLFRESATGKYYDVQTQGEPMDGDPPGKDFGVTGIFLATITGTVVNFDNIKETADNILEPFTPWVAEKGVGGDGFDQTDATIAVEPKSPQDETSIKFNGAAFITRMRHAGYVAKDFNRSINDDNRTDFTKIELPIVSVYYYQSPFIDQGVPTVYKVVEGQKTYENQALLTWFGKYATATPAQTPDQPK